MMENLSVRKENMKITMLKTKVKNIFFKKSFIIIKAEVA